MGFEDLDEEKLTKIIRKNKVFRKLDEKLSKQPNLKKEFQSRYPKLLKTINELKVYQDKELAEFVKISSKLSSLNIHLLLIKSCGEFPFESSNIDCLVKPDNVAETLRVLGEEGYKEYPAVREPHKFLFRKVSSPKEVPLHIHTKVEWEAVEFADEQDLMNRARPFLDKQVGALVPSIEDALLITIAHYFFEDHEVKINDLLKLLSLIDQGKPNWKYILNQAAKIGWDEALFLNMKMINKVGFQYFGLRLFPETVIEQGFGSSSFFTRIIKLRPEGTLDIPYGVSALYFFRRIAQNRSCSVFEKTKRLVYACSDILRRRTVGYLDI